MDSPWLDLTTTYNFQTGTGGVKPKYGTLGDVVLSKYTVMFNFTNLFLGSDLPANFSDMYFVPKALSTNILASLGMRFSSLTTAYSSGFMPLVRTALCLT